MDSKSETRWHPTVGLVIGLGIGAGLYYYRRLTEEFRASHEEARLLLAQADFTRVAGYTSAGALAPLQEYLGSIVQTLARAGCHIAAVTAVTPHVCIEGLTSLSTIPLLSILDSVAFEVHRRRVTRVSLFGTRLVIETDLFGALAGVECIRPTADEIDTIDTTYRRLAAQGHGIQTDREALTRIARRLCDREGVGTIILAGTDLSDLFSSGKREFDMIDSSDAHIMTIVETMRRIDVQ